MTDKDYKRAEREICVDFGGKRTGPLGFNVPDCRGTPGIAIEVKLVPSFRWRESWWQQAGINAQPGEAPVLIQKQRGTGKKIVMCDYDFFKLLYLNYRKEI